MRKTIVLNYNTPSTNAQLVSSDLGVTWGAPQSLAGALGALNKAATGPGVGLQLGPTNPHHPGRILFIG